ncbi:hypothetical protein LTR47_008674 [Exophiala xenobiotica]|nr:hypothetical protein LTR47_008674 [Exophiala xenobiotica]KAK5241527.1 hypothetical protein LTS06_012047 [Exophiala xenobiotica]KAK5277980.1 hypothetical protein LTR40_009726 [Exophiala xenobiotica]KAK5315788.1 hypothetical protein LTR93_009648 [Exophiala xenobiotica]KAK5346504.1 hypothetical protein LTR61_009706 [Exophiala xenobiotica]
MTGTQASYCAGCNAQTSKTCQGCADAGGFVDGATKTFYCGVQCQKADWQAHKKTCKRLKSHKSLYQAGKVLRVLWLAFRTYSMCWNIDKVQIQSENITFWQTFGFYGGDVVLEPFAHHLFADEKLKEAVLDCGACNNVYNIDYIVRSLLSEVTLKIANKRHGIVYFHRNNASTAYEKCSSTNWCKASTGETFQRQAADREPTVHQVFRVRLKATNEYFVIDLTNAQFGFFDTVIPWEKYLSERVSGVRAINSLGTYDWVKWEGLTLESIRDLDLKTFTALRLEQLFESWQSENDLTTAQLIAVSGTNLTDRCAELEKHLSNGLTQSWKQAERFCDLAWELRCETERKKKLYETTEFLKRAGLLDRAWSPNNHRWVQSLQWLFRLNATSLSTSSGLSAVLD